MWKYILQKIICFFTLKVCLPHLPKTLRLYQIPHYIDSNYILHCHSVVSEIRNQAGETSTILIYFWWSHVTFRITLYYLLGRLAAVSIYYLSGAHVEKLSLQESKLVFLRYVILSCYIWKPVGNLSGMWFRSACKISNYRIYYVRNLNPCLQWWKLTYWSRKVHVNSLPLEISKHKGVCKKPLAEYSCRIKPFQRWNFI